MQNHADGSPCFALLQAQSNRVVSCCDVMCSALPRYSMGGFGAIQLGSFAPQDAASCVTLCCRSATVAAHELSLSLNLFLSFSFLSLQPRNESLQGL